MEHKRDPGDSVDSPLGVRLSKGSDGGFSRLLSSLLKEPWLSGAPGRLFRANRAAFPC